MLNTSALDTALVGANVSSMTSARSLSESLGTPVSRVVRRALVIAARSPDPLDTQAGIALLRDAITQDEDVDDRSTVEILTRLARGERPDGVLDLMYLAFESDLVLPIDVVSDVCNSFASRGRLDLVQRAVDYLHRTNQPPDDSIRSSLLLAHAKRNDPAAALEAYDVITRPAQSDLATLVACLVENGDPNGAVRQLDRFIAANPDNRIRPDLLGTVAGAVAKVDPRAGVDKLIETDLRGSNRSGISSDDRDDEQLTAVLLVLDRAQEFEEALRLLGHFTARGLQPSDHILDALVRCLRGVRDPCGLVSLLPQLVALLDPRHWAALLLQNMPGNDRNPAWLQLVRAAVAPPEVTATSNAVEATSNDRPGWTLVSALEPSLFAHLLDLAVQADDRGSLRWLLQHRGSASKQDFKTALRLPVNAGDAELARLLVADMFGRGVAPDIDAFRAVGRSYSGSLSGVLDTFEDLVSRASQGNPHRIARLFMTAVLTEYAVTNQARQWGDVLAKFEGWPKLEDWKLMDSAMMVLTTSRPRDAADATLALMPSLGRPPRHLLGQAVLWGARTGDLVGVRGLLSLADSIYDKPDHLTRRRAGLLALTDKYLRIGDTPKSWFKNPPWSSAEGEEWLPRVQRELTLIGALVNDDGPLARRTYEASSGSLPGALPLRALVKYMLVVQPDGDALQDLLLTLQTRFPDATRQVEEAIDILDAAHGRQNEIVGRLLSPGSFVTVPRVKAYAAAVFDSDDHREQAVARYLMLSRTAPESQRAQLLLRAFSEIHADRAKPDAVRRVFKDLSVLTHPGPRAWDALQRATRNSPEARIKVLDEMLATGIAPDLGNLRPVVSSLGKMAAFADAEQIIERFDVALSHVEKAALYSQLVVAAASIERLDLAEEIRDKVWSLSQTLTPGADAAWHAARVRAGLEKPLTGVDGQTAQLSMDVFVRDVGHELENLLGSVWTGVDFALDVLESEADTEKAIRLLTPVRDVTKPRFDRLMDHWQTMADDEAVSGEQTDVGKAIRQLFRLQQEKAGSAGVRLLCPVPDGRFYVQVSALHLDVILRQLLDNAIFHLGRATGSDKYVRVLVTELPESTENFGHAPVRISVLDNGPGIPAKHRTAIYESGFSTKAGRGVGRGLAIANSVVLMAGGTISVESREQSDCDSGQAPYTLFNITLPRTASERNEVGEIQ